MFILYCYLLFECHHGLFPIGFGLGEGLLEFAILLEECLIGSTCGRSHPLLQFFEF